MAQLTFCIHIQLYWGVHADRPITDATVLALPDIEVKALMIVTTWQLHGGHRCKLVTGSSFWLVAAV